MTENVFQTSEPGIFILVMSLPSTFAILESGGVEFFQPLHLTVWLRFLAFTLPVRPRARGGGYDSLEITAILSSLHVAPSVHYK